MGKKEQSKICIMVIPHTKKVRRLMIPSWLPKLITLSIIGVSISILLIITTITWSHSNLKEEYEDKISEINALQEENKNKELEILRLKNQKKELLSKSEEIEKKLEEIDKLQRDLEKMAGIKNPSRSSTIRRNIPPEISESSDKIQVLKETLELKEKELETFIDQMEERLAYLETVPDLWPARGRLTSRFGNRKNPFGRGTRFHYGIDIANSVGTDIWAAGKGVVTFAGTKGGYGRTIIIDHGNGYKTLYAHNSKLLVKVGDRVEKGQVIAKMGSTGRSTGSHLHFEVHKSGKPINPLNILN